MKRSLLYQLGGPGEVALEAWVAEVTLAERLGVDTLWCLPSLDDSGAYHPDTVSLWLSAVSARTKRIRLGWGVPGMMPPDRPPIRTAEQAASLDQSCRGRLDLAFLPDEARTTQEPSWDEGIRMLVEMWDRPKFSWGSERFEVPPVDVLPKPCQKPHPPLFLVGWSDAQARTAGRAGMGFLDVSGAADETLEIHRDGYREAREEVDALDLVCHSAFAVALEYAGTNACRERLESFAKMEIDEAVLRADGAPHAIGAADAPQAASDRIRALVGEPSGLH